MKILMVHDAVYPLYGGSVERTLKIAKALVDKGHTLDLLTLSRGFDKGYASRNGINRVFFVPSLRMKYLIPFFNPYKLKRICVNYDVVHISCNWSLLSYYASLICKRHKVPFIFSPMGYINFTNDKSVLIKRLYLRFCTSFILKNCKFCITVSKNEFEDCLTTIDDSKKAVLIPNGFNQEDFVKPDKLDFKSIYNLHGRKTLLFLGRMDPIKGIDNLITAFMNLQAYASDWQLVIIGPRNDYRSRLEEVVRNSNGSHSVFFVDPMFGKEKIDAYFSSDVFVVPSLFDAMTIVAVEAAACSIPVLITETSDFKSLYENGGAIQVSPTVEGLELGLLKIFGSKDEELKEMGRKGCEYVSRSLEWRILGEKFNRIFIEAVNPVD